MLWLAKVIIKIYLCIFKAVMGYIRTILRLILPVMVVTAVMGCGEEGVISKGAMANIVAEMYLADQYIEKNPEMMGQTDSLAVYPAVIEKNGYTVEEYKASVRYYLQRDDEYNLILKSAMASMEEYVKELEEEVEKQVKMQRGPDKWWALDSVRKMNPDELLYNPVMRGVRWMVIPQERVVKWAMGDSAVLDIPQNPQWWKNTLNAPKSRAFSAYFFPEAECGVLSGRKVVRDNSTVAGKDTVKVEKTPEEIQRERAEKLRQALMYGKPNNNIITEEVEEEEIELP